MSSLLVNRYFIDSISDVVATKRAMLVSCTYNVLVRYNLMRANFVKLEFSVVELPIKFLPLNED